MMKPTVMFILFTLTVLSVQAQSDTLPALFKPGHTINIGLHGDASIVSISYERLFHIRPDHFLTGKAGLGFNQEVDFCILPDVFPCEKKERNFLAIPHHVTSNYGRGNHFGEIGLGGTFLIGNTKSYYIVYPILGYRYLPMKTDALCFRIFAMYPFAFSQDIAIWRIPVGVSLGGTF